MGPLLLHGRAEGHCMLHRLGGALRLDSPLHAASTTVQYREAPRGACPRVELWPHDAAAGSHPPLALGHQSSPSSPCPATADDGAGTYAAPRLAAVVLALDQHERLLLTRRPRGMRTFPGAWVLPGGSVDDADASVRHAALRELCEETGIALPPEEAPERPFCLWESCYPTSALEWRQTREQRGRTSHFLIVYFVVRVADSSRALRLQPDECDRAAWVPLADVACIGKEARGDQLYPLAPPAQGHVSAHSLDGVYPNDIGEGVGRGHLWAIRQLREHLLHSKMEDDSS
ncbi:hypothetical protein AB1Y20_018138 [Prymnesium parvum]|uniref:Nudix hydrolase domain-containing protein n=1 Tax=Prymnesium parvum TaxID=97485 RepID=A0AB34JMM6_PRYPA